MLPPPEHVLVQLNRRGTWAGEEQLHLPAGRERARVAHRHLGGRGAQHQGLAATDEQANGSVVCRYLRGLHILVDFADDLLALVQQVVGGLPVACGTCNLFVDCGHLLGQAVDGVGAVLQLLGHRVLDLVDAVGRGAHARRGFVDASEHQGARRQVGGGSHHVRERVHHVGDGGPQPCGAAAEDLLQLAQPLRTHRIPSAHRSCCRRLAREQLALVAQDGAHIHPLPDVARARELPLHGLQCHGLARIPGGVDVGNVVASRLQGHLVGHQGASADVEQSHDLHRFHHACAFWARSALWMAPLSFLAYSGSVA